MSGARTEWHLADLSSDVDPFDVAYSAGIELDLTASEDELFAQLRALVTREARMFNLGLSCQYKDDGMDCLACPHATLDPTEERSRLCRLGKDQRSVLNAHDAKRDAAASACGEMAAVAEEASEMGYLTEELAELLTEVGL